MKSMQVPHRFQINRTIFQIHNLYSARTNPTYVIHTQKKKKTTLKFQAFAFPSSLGNQTVQKNIKSKGEKKRKFSNLESVLVTLRLPKVLRDMAKLWKGNLVVFTDPILKNVGDASLGQPHPEDSALKVLIFLRVLDTFSADSTWREQSRNIGSQNVADDAARTAFPRVCNIRSSEFENFV